MTEQVHILKHPLIQHKLTILRDKNTNTRQFRQVVSEIAVLMCYEVCRDLPTEEAEIQTPLESTKGRIISGKNLAVVPVLRTGLGMVDGILALLPTAKVGHIGLYRDQKTMDPVEYYCKLPEDIDQRDVILLDPMIATGGSTSAALQFMKGFGCRSVRLMALIATEPGLKQICKAHPDVPIYCVSVDERLDVSGYIAPGLGDAGDRIFGTK